MTIGAWNNHPNRYWSRKQVAAWRDRVRAFASQLK